MCYLFLQTYTYFVDRIRYSLGWSNGRKKWINRTFSWNQKYMFLQNLFSVVTHGYIYEKVRSKINIRNDEPKIINSHIFTSNTFTKFKMRISPNFYTCIYKFIQSRGKWKYKQSPWLIHIQIHSNIHIVIFISNTQYMRI